MKVRNLKPGMFFHWVRAPGHALTVLVVGIVKMNEKNTNVIIALDERLCIFYTHRLDDDEFLKFGKWVLVG